jgi:hypothetical protein
MIRNGTQRPDAKGRSFEVLRQFLDKYFPKNLDFFSGFNVEPNDSNIIVSDRFKTAIFYESTRRVVPVEYVYLVMEVKSF